MSVSCQLPGVGCDSHVRLGVTLKLGVRSCVCSQVDQSGCEEQIITTVRAIGFTPKIVSLPEDVASAESLDALLAMPANPFRAGELDTEDDVTKFWLQATGFIDAGCAMGSGGNCSCGLTCACKLCAVHNPRSAASYHENVRCSTDLLAIVMVGLCACILLHLCRWCSGE